MYLGKYYIINIGFISKTLKIIESSKKKKKKMMDVSLKLLYNILTFVKAVSEGS